MSARKCRHKHREIRPRPDGKAGWWCSKCDRPLRAIKSPVGWWYEWIVDMTAVQEVTK